MLRTQLKWKVTAIMIAHRLSAVMNTDTKVYKLGGNILAGGSLTEVREMNPDFDNQAMSLWV